MIQEEFCFYRPSELLQRYVRYYWVFKSYKLLNTLTFPIGCTQLIFHKQEPLYIPELNSFQKKVTVSGQVNFSSHLFSGGNLEMIVVVFYPHASSLFLNFPASHIYNKEVSGDSIGNKSFNELVNRVSDCEDINLCLKYIDDWLLSRISCVSKNVLYKIGRVEASLKQLFIVPQLSVTKLADNACLSKRQFEREFNTYVGMNPKEYARIVRFQKALYHIQKKSSNDFDAIETAYLCGYTDQSHFIREFKRISGFTPGYLLKNSETYSDLFTNPV